MRKRIGEPNPSDPARRDHLLSLHGGDDAIIQKL